MRDLPDHIRLERSAGGGSQLSVRASPQTYTQARSNRRRLARLDLSMLAEFHSWPLAAFS